jgi:hypothetical protein
MMQTIQVAGTVSVPSCGDNVMDFGGELTEPHVSVCGDDRSNVGRFGHC